jgi:hypothetical protein
MRAALLALTLLGCSRPVASAPSLPVAVEVEASAREATRDEVEADARVDAPPDAPGVAPSHSAPALTAAQAAQVLFVGDAPRPPCDAGDDAERVRCLITARYASDERAAQVARELYDRTGDVAGVLAAETMEGGWRGTLHLVPALPVLKDRNHLEWLAEATRDYDAFFRDLVVGQTGAPRYVWRAYALCFMRSVAARTPSAYSLGWRIAYNLSGSLNTSADAVRELLFHEMFHSNDQDHADWSTRALGATFDSIVARCGARIACLTPFTPTEMTVRGGTYYAFQPNNGAAVREYAAELALRYYREQRALLRGQPSPRRFKCGPRENAMSWRLLVDEFFGGIDLTPAC